MPRFVSSKSEYSRRYYQMYKDRILQHYYDKKQKTIDDKLPANYYYEYYKNWAKLKS